MKTRGMMRDRVDSFVSGRHAATVEDGGEAREKCPGGRRKSLKRFDPDKEIKVNSFVFLWPGLAGFGWIWSAPGDRRGVGGESPLR